MPRSSSPRPAAVEAHARRVERPGAVGLHPRPRDREAVGLQAERRHQVEVLAPAVVVVAGDVAGVAVRDGARQRGRRCPRSSRRARPRAPRPRSGRRRWRRRSGIRAGSWARAATYRGGLAADGSGGWERVPCTGADGGRWPRRGEPSSAVDRGRRAMGRVYPSRIAAAPPPLGTEAHLMASVVSGSKKCRCSMSTCRRRTVARRDGDVGRQARGEASAREVGSRVSANLARDFELVLGEHRRSVDGGVDQQVGAQRLDELDGRLEHLVVVVAGGCVGHRLGPDPHHDRRVAAGEHGIGEPRPARACAGIRGPGRARRRRARGARARGSWPASR